MKSHPVDPINRFEFDAACGVGVVVTREDIVMAIRSAIEAHREELISKRYNFNIGKILGKDPLQFIYDAIAYSFKLA